MHLGNSFCQCDIELFWVLMAALWVIFIQALKTQFVLLSKIMCLTSIFKENVFAFLYKSSLGVTGITWISFWRAFFFFFNSKAALLNIGLYYDETLLEILQNQVPCLGSSGVLNFGLCFYILLALFF